MIIEEELTPQETRVLRAGRCPDCGEQLYEGPRGGLAMNVRCVNLHTFWVGFPFPPKRLTQKIKEENK